MEDKEDINFLVKKLLSKGFNNYGMFNNKLVLNDYTHNLFLKLCEQIFIHYKEDENIKSDKITIENLEYLRCFYEMVEDYERCDDILKIKNKLNEKD